jgi:hypothetical protein
MKFNQLEMFRSMKSSQEHMSSFAYAINIYTIYILATIMIIFT